MAKKYDFEKAKGIVDSRKDEIVCASLGMYEDWFWTAETVFEDGRWNLKGDKIAGIDGSDWATPALLISLQDGSEECFPCYSGESSKNQPSFPILGVLSEPVQERMAPLSFKEK